MTSLGPATTRSPARLFDRYDLLDELPPITGGRLFRARDLAFAEIVAVRQLGAGCGLPPEERRTWEETVRHLQCLPHPNLVRLDSFDAESGLLIHEWVHGLSLLDLLRRRRALSVPEVSRLLAALPATLDFLAREAVPVPRPLLGKLLVQFPEEGLGERLSATPVDQWPPFTLKLNAISSRGLMAPASLHDTEHTVIADPRQPSEVSESYGPREFARLLYELLGGRIRELDLRRYSPLGVLREAGNAVLRRTLLAMPHADCQVLWQDLLDAQPDFARVLPPVTANPTSAVRSVRIPEPLLGGAFPAAVLHLEPDDPGGTPIRLVTGPRFRIGRSSQQADFIARVLPQNEANNALTNRLSRVHALLEIGEDDGLQVRDGSGSGPSVNGSFLDGQSLPPAPPTPLAHRSRLWLGEEYALELIHVASAAARHLEISNIADWPGPAAGPTSGPCGALIGLPAQGQVAVRHAIWLFTEAGFGLDAAGHLVWDTREPGESPCAFHYHRGCFWLRNHSQPETAIACNAIPLGRDHIAPLVPGTVVRLGEQSFTAHLDEHNS